MNGSTYRVRRATLEDLNTLRPLWESMRLPVADLERRLIEFQVAESPEGKIVGAIGFQAEGRYARIHSESFSDFAATDAVRPLFWERIQTLTRNHGIVRVWTREQVPFWKQHGFQPATADQLKKIPVAWDNTQTDWLTVALRDEDTIVSLEKELAMYKEAEKQRTARMFQQARVLKTIATLLAVAFAIFVMWGLFYLFRKNPNMIVPPNG
jgi:N-acetylglutamate synthase-like GNAT family acetyltransferase